MGQILVPWMWMYVCMYIWHSVTEWHFCIDTKKHIPFIFKGPMDQELVCFSPLDVWKWRECNSSTRPQPLTHWCDVTPHKSGILEKFHLSWIKISCMRYQMCANQHCIRQTACSVDCQCETLKCAVTVGTERTVRLADKCSLLCLHFMLTGKECIM